MKILLLLGKNDEYLTYLVFRSHDLLNRYIEKLEPLMIANIEKELPLKERLKLIDEYFPFAGKVEDFEVIDLDEKNICSE